jgi:zinc/manganese transport system permease protein
MIQSDMFSQPFMQNALVTGTIVACIAGLVGFFVVLRGVSFAAHSLAQIGFAGAAGAVLLGIDPLIGLVAFAMAGAVAMGALGTREHGRDVATGLILVASLGAGALFLALNNTYATAAFDLLFGSIVGISRTMVWQTAALSMACAIALAVMYRPLLLSTIHIELAEARGVRVRLVGMLFLVVVGVAAAVTVPTVGTLLIFSLMIGPAASSMYLTSRPVAGIIVSVAIAEAVTWVGMIAAYDTGWPIGFLISALAGAVYLGARLYQARWAPVRRAVPGAHSHMPELAASHSYTE